VAKEKAVGIDITWGWDKVKRRQWLCGLARAQKEGMICTAMLTAMSIET